MTTTRDQYVEQLKARLDRWNAEMAVFETKAKAAREEAGKRYEDDLNRLRAQREKALYQLKLLEGASAAAWQDFRRGADEAWDLLGAAVSKARTHFEK